MSITQRQLKWDRRFLRLAEHISGWSKDPGTQVAALIADPKNRIVSVGYNGLPVGIQDTEDLLKERAIKLETTIHAETNAILFARRNLTGCTLYVHPLFPCSRCAGLIVQTGIGRVVAPLQNKDSSWGKSFDLSRRLFREALVLVDFVESDTGA